MFLLSRNFLLNDFRTWLLAMFSFFMPFSLLLNVNTAVLILLLLVVCYELYKSQKIIRDNTWVLIIYFLLLCFTLVYSENLELGVVLVVKSLFFILIPLGLITVINISERQLRAVSIGFYTGNLLAFFGALIYAITVYKTNPLPLQNGFSYFTNVLDIHPSYYSIYLLFSTALIFYTYRNNKKFNILLKSILLLTLILLQMYLKSRAGLISTALVVLLYSFINFKKGFIVVFIIIISILYTLKDFNNHDFLNRNLAESIQDRLSIWTASVDVIKNNFIFGVGIGDYQQELDRQYYLNVFDHGINDRLNCHNQFLQTFVNRGLIGFLSLLSILGLLIIKYIKTKSEIILYFLIPVIVLMFFDSILVRQHGILFFVFFSTILIKYNQE